MRDSRFGTVATTFNDLLRLVDIDDAADVETLLIVLLGAPVEIAEVGAVGGVDAHLHAKVWLDDRTVDAKCFVPTSMLELVRVVANGVIDACGCEGVDDPAYVASQGVSAMDDDLLTSSLQRALGEVRLYNILTGDE